jgi:D-alanyl-D-alanine carboxypeptidase (penicillin-binding protein 5/6)
MTFKQWLSAGFVAITLAVSSTAYAIETKAQYAIMIDYDTGSVLYAKSPDTQMHPSSMSKLMTSYVLYKHLKDGSVKLTDKMRVSEKAWRMQGSKTFVHIGDEIPVEDLLRGIVIQSGNDACVVVAEGIAGSEEGFAAQMNAAAKEMGMTNSHFVNATGWPDDGHLMSARDLATLATHLINDFPEHYHYYSEKEFVFNGIKQQNRNRLLGNDIGVDGLKTGHTDAGGYGITLSAKDPQTGRRLILVINGLESDNDRVEEGDKLLRYGLREFTDKTLAKAGDAIDQIPVWMGDADTVAATPAKDLVVTLPVARAKETTFTLRYDGPVAAPIAKGASIASLIVKAPDQEPVTIPLVAAQDVPKRSGFGKLMAVLRYYVSGGQHAAAR